MIIVTIAETDFDGSATEAAVIVRVTADSLGATVSSPFELIFVLDESAPETVHLTAVLGLFVPVIEALN